MMPLIFCLQLRVFLLLFSVIDATATATPNHDPTSNDHSTNSNNSSTFIINRQLEASIIAHQWITNPSTPFCETFAFLDSAIPSASSRSSKQSFFQSLTSPTAVPATDYNEAIRKAAAAASDIVGADGDEKLLLYSLATRAHAPFCEMHDSLARAALDASSSIMGIDMDMEKKHPLAFVVKIVQHNSGMHQLSYAQDVKQNGQIRFIPVDEMEMEDDADDMVWAHPLSDEHIFLPHDKMFSEKMSEGGDDQSRDEAVVLYGPFDSREFAMLYGALLDQAIPFVVRHRHVNSHANDNVNGSVDDDSHSSGNGNGNDNDSTVATEGHHHTSDTSVTRLQGYGVRLDIRNVEYKSFDDKADDHFHSSTTTTTTASSSTKQNPNDPMLDSESDKECHEGEEWTMEEMKQILSNGIDPNLLSHPTPLLQTFFEKYLPNLESMMTTTVDINEVAAYSSSQYAKDQAFIPPRDELTQLALQATTVISQSEDPLWTMMVLTQNLPSFAAYLGNVTVPSLVETEALEMERMLDKGGRGGGMEGSFSPSGMGIMEFHVNGRRISVERPSFNVFELINVVREEKDLLRSIVSLGLGRDMSGVVADLLSGGKEVFDTLVREDGIGSDVSGIDGDGDGNGKEEDGMGMMNVKEPKLRIDVGSGYKGAVIYLNDIERDAEYQQWPSSIEQALYGIQYGGSLVIRRNILTILLVMDPFDEDNRISDVLGLLMQMMQSGTPIRIGILFANNEDIDACRAHGESGSDVDGVCLQFGAPLQDDASIMEGTATSEMIMKIYQHVVKTYDKSIGFPYLFLLSGGLAKGMTVQDVASVHAQALARMGVPVEDPISDIMIAIRVELSPDSKADNYAKAAKFAVMKNIRPGMAFVNGIPLPTQSPEGCQEILSEEMQSVIGKMLTGKITDSSPRSIYAMLLKGNNVRSSMHPLLADDLPEYRVLSSNDDEFNLVVLQATTVSERPRILISIVADLISSEGLENVSSVLTAIDKYITKAKGYSSIAIRIIPNSLESSRSILGVLLRGASRFDIADLIELVGSALKSDTSNGMLSMDDFDCSPNTRQLADEVINGDKCSEDARVCAFEPIGGEFNTTVVMFVNGRVFIPSSTIHADDIDMLIDLEQGAAKTITRRLAKYEQGPLLYTAVSKAAEYLGKSFSSQRFNANERSNIFAGFEVNRDHEDDLLRFSWNAAKGGKEEALEVSKHQCVLSVMILIFLHNCVQSYPFVHIRSKYQ
jgi:UDP-glucose:glycoprotein glucosyltransferase